MTTGMTTIISAAGAVEWAMAEAASAASAVLAAEADSEAAASPAGEAAAAAEAVSQKELFFGKALFGVNAERA